MSEDDIDGLGPDGSMNAVRIDRDRRAPRFSWTPAYETTFFRSLCESVQLGLRENSSFKAEAWERAAAALQATHGAYPAKSHLINKSDNARKRFRLWRGLREDPDFLYDPVMRTVTATEDAWKAHIEKEPLSRALRGRPFEHEDFMEILYPDVVGSGGAPKRIMKPRRRTDGTASDETEMPGTGVLNLQGPNGKPATDLLVPGNASQQPPSQQQRPLLSQTPSSNGSMSHQQQPIAPASLIPTQPNPAAPTTSALTPPDDTQPQGQTQPARKRRHPDSEGSPPLANAVTAGASLAPEKRRRTSAHDSAASSASGIPTQTPTPPIPTIPPIPSRDTQAAATASAPQLPIIEELLEALRNRALPRWREQALDIFFQEFADEDLDLQVKISENVLSIENKAMVFCKMPNKVRQHWVGKFREMHQLNHKPALDSNVFSIQSTHTQLNSIVITYLSSLIMSYADIAASGPKQSPEEAAAPQPPQVVTNESASTASLIDVDLPSVHTVPSDFADQDIQTETQAKRLELEAEAKKSKAKKEAKKADNWLQAQFAKLSDGSAGAVAVANLAGVVGLSALLGYKAWGLYERGTLSWKDVGLGAGILASVGIVEGVVGRYLYKGKKE